MTLAPRPELAHGELERNWQLAIADLEAGLGPDDVALMSQVHGATVIEVTAPTGPGATIGEADGAWTAQTGVVLAVRTADCVPVLLAAPGGVAVAHAGWRGTVAGVVRATVEALCAGTGCVPSTVVAAIGPCISGAAYEVGDEVVEGLRSAGLPDAAFLHPHTGPRPHVDLGRAVEAQLRALGVHAVERIARCTQLDPELHSHRRSGVRSGRQAGLIARLP